MEGPVDMVTEVLEEMVKVVMEVMEGPGVMEGQVENTEAEKEGNMEVANMDLLMVKGVVKMSSTFMNKDIFKNIKNVRTICTVTSVNTFFI